jgi:hypothetical protein
MINLVMLRSGAMKHLPINTEIFRSAQCDKLFRTPLHTPKVKLNSIV